MSNYIVSDVKCPFYKNDKSLELMCEGAEKDTITKISFKSKKQKEKHTAMYCCKNYQRCRVARMLYEKYKE